jgi:hypothetical protein
MCSGIPALVSAATHDQTDDCSDCGTDCPGSHDPGGCPPGPLCPCAPHVLPAERVPVVLVSPFVYARPTTHPTDTRLPASVVGDGVFHPPRRLG